MSVRKIISGGQTGADRAALDFARDTGVAIVATLARWLDSHQVRCLNVAGSRASEDARIYAATYALLGGNC